MVTLKYQVVYGKSIAASSIFGPGELQAAQTFSISAHVTQSLHLEGRVNKSFEKCKNHERRFAKTALPGMRMLDDLINDYVVAPSMNAQLINGQLLWSVRLASTLFEAFLRTQYFLNQEAAAMRGLPQVFAFPSLSSSSGVNLGMFQQCEREDVGVLVHRYSNHVHKMYMENSLCSLVMPISVDLARFYDVARWKKMRDCFSWTDATGVEHGWRNVLLGDRTFREEQIECSKQRPREARIVTLSGAESEGVFQSGLVHIKRDRWMMPFGFDPEEVIGRLNAMSSSHPDIVRTIEKISCVCRMERASGYSR